MSFSVRRAKHSPFGLQALCLGLYVWLQLWSSSSPAPGWICCLLMKAWMHPVSRSQSETVIPTLSPTSCLSQVRSVIGSAFLILLAHAPLFHIPLTKPSLSPTLVFFPASSTVICSMWLWSRLVGFAYYWRMSNIYRELIKLHCAIMKMSEGGTIGFVLAAFWRDCLLLSRREKINLHHWEVSQGRPGPPSLLWSLSLSCCYLLLFIPVAAAKDLSNKIPLHV